MFCGCVKHQHPKVLQHLGVVFDAPTDVQLSETDIVQPDLVIVLQPNLTIITPTKLKGTPDLVVEIISPSSSNNDRVLKRELYRRAGVPGEIEHPFVVE